MATAYTSGAAGQYGQIRGGTDYSTSQSNTHVTLTMNGFIDTYYNALFGMQCNYSMQNGAGGSVQGVSNNAGASWGRVATGGNIATSYGRTSGAYTIGLYVHAFGTVVSGYGAYSGNTGSQHVATITVPALPTPSAPSNCTHTRTDDNQNIVSWVNNGTNPRSNTLIERSVDGGGYSQIVAAAGTATSYVDNTTQPDHYYSYRVRAVFSANGHSMYSGFSNESTPTYNSPIAPTELVVSRATETTILAEFRNASLVATGIEYQRSNDGSAWSAAVAVSGIALTSFMDNPGGGTWFFRVRNTRGALVSQWSTISNAVVTIIPPAAPTLTSPLNGSVVNKAITPTRLAWVHNPIDGSAQTAAQVRISTDNGTTWTTIQINGSASYYDHATSWAANAKILWQVRTKGAHADYGAWSSSASFNVYQVPQVAITSPADDSAVITTLPINVVWSYTDQSGNQVSAVLSLFNATGQRIWTKTIQGAATSYDIRAADILPDNGGEYSLRVSVTSSSTLTAQTSRGFTTDYLEPVVPQGYATVDRTKASVSLLVVEGTQDYQRTASGNPVTVEAVKHPILNLSLSGAYSQDGTPTPETPVPIKVIEDVAVRVSGKNLIPWPYRRASGSTHNGITFTINPDKSISATGTSTGTATFGMHDQTLPPILMPPGTYKVSGGVNTGRRVRTTTVDMVTGASLTFNSHDNAVTFENPWQITAILVSIASGNTVTGETYYPQLELGSEATAYEPPQGYTEAEIPLNNDINYLDGVVIEQGTIDANGNNASNNSRIRTAGFVSVPSGGVLVTNESKLQQIICVYDENDVFLSRLANGTSGFVAIPTGAKLRVSWYRAPESATNPTHLIGQSVTTCNFLAELPGIEAEKYSSSEPTLLRIGKKVFDGTDNIGASGSAKIGEYYRWSFGVGGTVTKSVTEPGWNALSDWYGESHYDYTGDYSHFYVSAGWVYIYTKDSTEAEIRARLAANPMTVYYPLAEPYTVDLPMTLPSLSDGTNTLMVVSDPAAGEVGWTYAEETPLPKTDALSIIRRHADGRQVILADQVPSGTAINDPYCPIGQDITYLFIAHTETGAVSRLEVPVRIPGELGCWINFGEKVCAVKLAPSHNRQTMHEVELFQTAGDDYAMAFYGRSKQMKGSITGIAVRDKTDFGTAPVSIADFDELAAYTGIVVIRLPYWDAFCANITVSQGTLNRHVETVSIEWERVRNYGVATL